MKVQTPRRITCPRCAAPVTGDFKFCPACAFRLQPGAPAEPSPEPPGSRVGTAVLLVGAGALLAGLVAFGVLLFRDRAGDGGSARPQRLGRTLAVADLAGELVDIPRGVAYWTDTLERVEVEATRFLKYEVTRGQWAEFLRDLAEHGERVPEFLRRMWVDPAERDYLAIYVDEWWTLAKAHLERGTGRPVERPAGLTPPLSDAFGILCLVPPTWTYLKPFEEIGWRLPRETQVPIPENLPVTEVSWFDAVAFSQWASEVLGITLDLPTQAEWRRAAHGNDPTDNEWPWGDEPFVYACNSANFWGTGAEPRPLPVDYVYNDAPGTTREGLFGMAGNAGEWSYPVPPKDGPVPAYAAWCGGSFRKGLDECTVWSQETREKYRRSDDVGFRLRAPPAVP